MSALLEYAVAARRVNEVESRATCKDAELVLDTALGGRLDAFNPAELLLASIAACMLKGIERVAPMLSFPFDSASIQLHGVRQDKPPKMIRIDYMITVGTTEPRAGSSFCMRIFESLERFPTPLALVVFWKAGWWQAQVRLKQQNRHLSYLWK